MNDVSSNDVSSNNASLNDVSSNDVYSNDYNSNEHHFNNYSNKEYINKLDLLLIQSEKLLCESTYKLNLIKDRLKENNCCPFCYNEFEDMQNKVISPCCKNLLCFECCDNWFSKMKKTNCIYCNIENIKYEDYVIIKPFFNKCKLCENEYEKEDNKYYAECCNIESCIECLKEWYHKLLKTECLNCHKNNIFFENFNTKKKFEEIRLNKQSGIIYTQKSKIDFLEYFIKTKIYAECKIIFCSNYIRIFDDLKVLFLKYNINSIELDDGNIEGIVKSINEYTRGNINVLLLNSNLFGCGLNLQCTTDIVFLHNTDNILEKQIIGRAQRYGRNNVLNVWYLMHDNETEIASQKNVGHYSVENNNMDFNYNFNTDCLIECTDFTLI